MACTNAHFTMKKSLCEQNELGKKNRDVICENVRRHIHTYMHTAHKARSRRIYVHTSAHMRAKKIESSKKKRNNIHKCYGIANENERCVDI